MKKKNDLMAQLKSVVWEKGAAIGEFTQGKIPMGIWAKGSRRLAKVPGYIRQLARAGRLLILMGTGAKGSRWPKVGGYFRPLAGGLWGG
jgi:hypothetical protein